AETGADTKKSNSKCDTKILNVVKEKGDDVSNMMALEETTVELDKGQAGSDPGKTPDSRPPPKRVLIEEDQAGSNLGQIELDKGQAGSDPGKTPDSRPPPKRVLIEEDQAGSNLGQSHVVQAGPNPDPTHEDFVAIVYPQVHESLKHTTEEHVHIKNPPSSSKTLLSIKNLDDAFTFSDKFLNDKPSKEEPGKANVETKVESLVTVPIHQASSTVPPLSTPIIDLTTPKPISYLDHAALYEALELSTNSENIEDFNEEMAMSRKRRRDDQHPPPPPKDSG
nr:hypothetical protein [Tanacetum cinerariifolium]